jgi:hypothetical protein
MQMRSFEAVQSEPLEQLALATAVSTLVAEQRQLPSFMRFPDDSDSDPSVDSDGVGRISLTNTAETLLDGAAFASCAGTPPFKKSSSSSDWSTPKKRQRLRAGFPVSASLRAPAADLLRRRSGRSFAVGLSRERWLCPIGGAAASVARALWSGGENESVRADSWR